MLAQPNNADCCPFHFHPSTVYTFPLTNRRQSWHQPPLPHCSPSRSSSSSVNLSTSHSVLLSKHLNSCYLPSSLSMAFVEFSFFKDPLTWFGSAPLPLSAFSERERERESRGARAPSSQPRSCPMSLNSLGCSGTLPNSDSIASFIAHLSSA